MYDLKIVNGMVILENQAIVTEIAIKDGIIQAIGNDLGSSKEIFDAKGFIVSPGMVDAHVHITDPGGSYRDDWEGYLTGTAACAKGGVTSFIEMPLNQIPATVDKKSLDIKFAAGQDKLYVDVASFGGLVPFNLGKGIQELHDGGVAAYKCFMATCGDRSIEGDFMNADDYTLYRGMQEIAKTGKVLAIHAENAAITDALGEEAYKSGKTKLSDYVATRPVFTEVEAINRAILFAKETGCRIHICHVACSEGVDAVRRAQYEGIDVSCETCTHYLNFDVSQIDAIGPVVKCSPPIRDKENQERMWEQVKKGYIDFIVSDHSPCSPDLKDTDNAFEAWGGIAGVQNNVDVLFDEGVQKRNLSLVDFGKLIASNPAKRYGLSQKGSLSIGKDADVVIIKPNSAYTLKASDLEYKNKISPYIGQEIGAQVVRTLVRGKSVYSIEKGLSTAPLGQFIKV